MRLNFTKFLFFLGLLVFGCSTSSAQEVQFEIVSPASIAKTFIHDQVGGVFQIGLMQDAGPSLRFPGGTYDICDNVYSGGVTTTGPLAVASTANDNTEAGNNTINCSADLPITSDISGSWALVDRGICPFVEKAKNVQDFGAISCLICNDATADESRGGVIQMGGAAPGIVINVVFLSFEDCAPIKAAMAAGEEVILEVRPVEGGGIETFDGPTESQIVDHAPPANFVYYEDFESYEANISGVDSLAGSPDPENNWTYDVTQNEYPQDVETDALVEDKDLHWTIGSTWKEFVGGFIFNDADSWESQLLNEGAVCGNFAVFDGVSAFYSESQNELGAYYPITSEFISPTIDLSGQTDMLLSVSMVQWNYFEDTENFLFAISNDNGATWGEPVHMPTENATFANIATGKWPQEFVNIPIFGVNGTSESRIKFIATNIGPLTLLIDDIYLSPLEGANATIVDVFYSPIAYAVPQSQACSDIYAFSVEVANRGADALNTVMLDVTVTNEGTGEVVFTDSGSVSDVERQGQTTVSTDNVLDPSGLPVGIYRMDYTISLVGQDELSTSDNTDTYYFEITNNKYATDAGDIVESTNGDDNDDQIIDAWGIGALYTTCGSAAPAVAAGIQIWVSSDSTSLTDNYLEYSLIEVDQAVVDGGFETFDFSETDIYSNPALANLFYQDIFVFDDSHEPGNFFTLPIPDIELTPGATYMLLVHADEVQTGSAQVTNSDLIFGATRNTTGGSAKQANGAFGFTFNAFEVYDGDAFTPYFGFQDIVRLCLNTGFTPPAPVEFGSIEATPMDTYIGLDWTTYTEVNNAGFEVERSTNGKDFEKIGFVEGNGNSSRLNSYRYNDNRAERNVTYYYRLKQVDIDGRFDYSDIVNATLANGGTFVSSIYPNPATKSKVSQIDISSELSANGTYKVIDQKGRIIATQNFSVTSGYNTIDINTSNLAAGVYFVNINAGQINEYKKLVVVD